MGRCIAMHNDLTKRLLLTTQVNHQWVIHTCTPAYKRRNNSIAQQYFQSCDVMCTHYITHPCGILMLAQARPKMPCIYTSVWGTCVPCQSASSHSTHTVSNQDMGAVTLLSRGWFPEAAMTRGWLTEGWVRLCLRRSASSCTHTFFSSSLHLTPFLPCDHAHVPLSYLSFNKSLHFV